MDAKVAIVLHWADIHQYITTKSESYIKTFEEDNLDISKKMLSEFVSQICESAFYTVLKDKNIDVYLPKVDNRADVIVLEQDVEIKTTTGENWRGGEFSKRPGLYVLLSWEECPSTRRVKLFAALQNMEESDWNSAMKKAAKEGRDINYYGTSYNKKDLIEQNKYTLLSGDIDIKSTKKDGTPMRKPHVKIKRE